jgi:tetratricopeptide (TPR) repeat protein
MDSWRYALYALVVVVFATATLVCSVAPKLFTYAYEDVKFALRPSAERAFDIGGGHLNAQNSREYDIVRAEAYFYKAAALNTDTPYLFHELARIAFLRGELKKALALINIQIAKFGDDASNSYYVRGLIEGYMGRYDAAASDYEAFLRHDPRNWAALNDLAWVLLKTGDAEKAREITQYALALFPDNPWLLNAHAIALFETGELEPALDAARRAAVAFDSLTEAEWLHAYPGNDPLVAGKGVATALQSALDNMHRIEAALALRVVQ